MSNAIEFKVSVEYVLYAADLSLLVEHPLLGVVIPNELVVDVEVDNQFGRIVITGSGPTWELAAEAGGLVVDAYLRSGAARLYP